MEKYNKRISQAILCTKAFIPNTFYKSTIITAFYKYFTATINEYHGLQVRQLRRLGPHSQPIRIKTTPLLRNPRRSSLYYVNLLAIRVGRKVLDIPPSAFAFDPNTGAGTVFDSGTVFTILVKPAYVAVRDEVRRRMRGATVTSLGGFDTCYSGAISLPTMTFMFSGMNVTLPQENFVIRSSAGSTACLAMAVNSALNVIASFQQQNHRILIDGAKSRLGVARVARFVFYAASVPTVKFRRSRVWTLG
ncbi:hypothetical protein SASPL_126517 [Salvia splendens]|uniref:Peptidase A1 domain-containing protein n=1 Tax=Salvia splendens TaxID=180675 RepID=A0A8X8ZQW1_SALSN|nr:aspartyl protease AED3-like [Salvia splendens]KAG6413802.1 hypothetical protein SASPL_126517 [Salvia splendens]